MLHFSHLFPFLAAHFFAENKHPSKEFAQDLREKPFLPLKINQKQKQFDQKNRIQNFRSYDASANKDAEVKVYYLRKAPNDPSAQFGLRSDTENYNNVGEELDLECVILIYY
jgi:hypothetical protein